MAWGFIWQLCQETHREAIFPCNSAIVPLCCWLYGQSRYHESINFSRLRFKQVNCPEHGQLVCGRAKPSPGEGRCRTRGRAPGRGTVGLSEAGPQPGGAVRGGPAGGGPGAGRAGGAGDHLDLAGKRHPVPPGDDHRNGVRIEPGDFHGDLRGDGGSYEWSDTEIEVSPPTRLAHGVSAVVVTVGGMASNGMDYTRIPTLTALCGGSLAEPSGTAEVGVFRGGPTTDAVTVAVTLTVGRGSEQPAGWILTRGYRR